MKNAFLALATILLLACSPEDNSGILHFSTTEQSPWTLVETVPSFSSKPDLTLSIDPSQRAQQIEGFGACFNELGWTSLSCLSGKDRSGIMEELFAPDKGACFTICRMPVGANDFSRQWYSYNEVDADFDMYNFSIDHDRATLVPFIKSALSCQPDLKIWASPWCPPSWMKHNRHYASRSTGEHTDPAYRNGLPKDRNGYEGSDMFIMEPEYLQAYALYFRKFIQAYRQEGITVFGVMPQNEFNSAQVFPSCCWTAGALAEFIGKYLGPAMSAEGVDLMMGTMERPDALLVDTVLQDPRARQYIKGVGFQWAGRDAIAAIHRNYPELTLYQSEQECGDGRNDWKGLLHSWELLQHYLRNGASVYDYWNISLLNGGISRWGWAQNSLIVVDAEKASYTYTLEYYLMKHISHFVKKGAWLLNAQGDAAGSCLVFENPDRSVIVLTVETEGRDRNLSIRLAGREYRVFIAANTINTMKLMNYFPKKMGEI